MAILVNDTTPRNQYTATSGQTVFAYSFEIFDVTDVKVYNGSTLLTYASSPSGGTQYSVSNAGVTGGGNITLGSGGASSGDTITIVRDIAVKRTTDFPSSGPFNIASLNTDLDKQVAMMGEREDEIARSIRQTDEDASATLTLPLKDARKGKVLSFNATSGNVETTVASTDVTTIAGIASDVTAVTAIASNVTTVAGIASNVTTVANDGTDIGVVAGKATEIGRLGTSDAVADLAILGTSAIVTDMDLLATSANVTAMGHLGTSANVTAMGLLGTSAVVTDMGLLGNADVIADMALLGNADVIADMAILATTDIVSDLNTLATSDIVTDLNTLATSDIVSDINTLATSDIVSDLNTLATSDIVTDLNILGTSANVTNMATLGASGVVGNIATVAGNNSNISTVAGANSNITAVAGNATNINAVAGNATNINTVAGANTNIGTVATNIAGVNSFAERYRVDSSDPSSSLDEGDLAFNTTANALKYYDGSAWQSIVAGSLTDVVQDGSPQLGGNLDVNGNSIVSVSNGNIAITPNGSGKVVLDGLSMPTADGNSGEALVTNGSGVISFSEVAGGGNYLGNDGEVGSDANDIIRVHSATLSYSGTLTLASTENGLVAGPLAVAGSTVLDVQGTLVVL